MSPVETRTPSSCTRDPYCQVPIRAVNLRSIIRSLCFLVNAQNSFGVMATHGLGFSGQSQVVSGLTFSARGLHRRKKYCNVSYVP